MFDPLSASLPASLPVPDAGSVSSGSEVVQNDLLDHGRLGLVPVVPVVLSGRLGLRRGD